MELREIATFLLVAQHKSFSKAARQSGYTQAAVTIQIKQLEKELGVHLFDRIGKQTTLTHQGAVFYEYASAVMRDLEHARDAVTGPGELTGRLCLGTIESICSSLLPDILTTYHRLHPQVNLSIVTDSPETLLEKMNSNAIDLVYFMDKQIYDPKWIKVLEEPEDIVFIAPSSHPFAAAPGPYTIDRLLTQPFLLTEKNASYRYLLDQYLASEGREIRPCLEIENTEFIIRLLKSGMGLSFLPRFTVQDCLDRRELTILPTADFSIRAWRQVVYHKDKWVAREMQEFIRLLTTTAR